LIIDVGLSLVESNFAVEYKVEAFGIVLLLIDKGLLFEFSEKHGVADMVDSRKVLDSLDGQDLG
jgi:hypothetical protein